MKVDDIIVEKVVRPFSDQTGLVDPDYSYEKKGGSHVIEFRMPFVPERFHDALRDILEGVEEVRGLPVVGQLRQVKKEEILDTAEARLFAKTLSEVQNVNRYTFKDDFFARYVRSVQNFESQINSAANHFAYGRRGAGKSMLLLFAWHTRRFDNVPSVWVDAQPFSSRTDEDVVLDIVEEVLSPLTSELDVSAPLRRIDALRGTTGVVDGLRKIIPSIRRVIGEYIGGRENLFVFLDDFHVLSKSLQPIVLDVLWAIARGNRTFLKISAIETLTYPFNPSTRVGMEVPQDAQALKLDYNLTAPDKTKQHIESILDGHATYAGLPNIRRMCASADVIPRLTWVSAGVPRDAISLFVLSMQKARTEDKKRVTVTSINRSSSDTLSLKLRDFDVDAAQNYPNLKELLSKIEDFCIKNNKSNAFLVKIDGSSAVFQDILKLVQLRLLHVISEGITKNKAGNKYLGVILDYGFYTGIRAAQSVELFNPGTEAISYADLRGLEVLKID